jgi:hypothetical protein
VQDPPEPTEEEHEAGPRRRREEDAMRYPGDDDPESVGSEGEEDGEDE